MKTEKAKKRIGVVQPIRVYTKVGKNAPCPCGSGRKFKKCCGGRNDPPQD